jgi:hypothetical protein
LALTVSVVVAVLLSPLASVTVSPMVTVPALEGATNVVVSEVVPPVKLPDGPPVWLHL